MQAIKYGLIVLSLLMIAPAATSAAPSEYTWSTDPSSGSVQDGFCYQGVPPDKDIDCAGVNKWCDSRSTNQACDESGDTWLCNNGEWACDNGERKEPNNVSACTSIQLKAPGCYSAFSGTYRCYSDGKTRWSALKPGGCSCQNDYECTSGLCQSGACISYVAPSISFSPTIQSLTLGIDEEQTINIRIGNDMARKDTINVSLGGRAVTEGLIAWDITESSGVSCNDDETRCQVNVDGKSSTVMSVSLVGAACTTDSCTGELAVTAVSSVSRLETTDSIPVQIQAVKDGKTVQAPGMTLVYLLVLLGLAGAYSFWQQ
ncbi:MAG: hypothetical protein SV186_06760 [Candidatus Nanohaloarchaea archaeon]|nr:hypothetical protein [Candidatus Nanohaloarchaea archaeon]